MRNRLVIVFEMSESRERKSGDVEMTRRKSQRTLVVGVEFWTMMILVEELGISLPPPPPPPPPAMNSRRTTPSLEYRRRRLCQSSRGLQSSIYDFDDFDSCFSVATTRHPRLPTS